MARETASTFCHLLEASLSAKRDLTSDLNEISGFMQPVCFLDSADDETFCITGASAPGWPYQGPHLKGEWDEGVAPKRPSSSKAGKGSRSLRREILSAMEGLGQVKAGVSVIAPLYSVSLGG